MTSGCIRALVQEERKVRIAAFDCDVAKACHHGSHDISYRFLEHVAAGATVVSSGDNEGYAHPRPEIVAASAATGHLEIDRQKDRLVRTDGHTIVCATMRETGDGWTVHDFEARF